ncbi:MAG TPA: rhodanese-like domain-containing protein [Anaeromyxobacteraceae bacterium]|jgi:rhodanese-related sulfurtransferase|nr:rhodanese-like domain-containing protein [Anaeromyxobacteraceae bacterium]
MTKPRAFALALLMLASGCASVGPRPVPAASVGAGASAIPPGIVDGNAAHALVASGVKVVDVRTPQEFQAGHVPGAVNIPHDQMDARHAELGPPSTPVLLYCRTGHRSGIARKALSERGFTALYDLQAYSRWLESEPDAGGR